MNRTRLLGSVLIVAVGVIVFMFKWLATGAFQADAPPVSDVIRRWRSAEKLVVQIVPGTLDPSETYEITDRKTLSGLAALIDPHARFSRMTHDVALSVMYPIVVVDVFSAARPEATKRHKVMRYDFQFVDDGSLCVSDFEPEELYDRLMTRDLDFTEWQVSNVIQQWTSADKLVIEARDLSNEERTYEITDVETILRLASLFDANAATEPYWAYSGGGGVVRVRLFADQIPIEPLDELDFSGKYCFVLRGKRCRFTLPSEELWRRLRTEQLVFDDSSE